MENEALKHASLPDIFLTFVKVGAFTIGGGWAMVPIIEREMVDVKGWIKKEDFIDLLAVAQTAPGLIAANISIVIGFRLRGFKGSVASVLGTILPSFLMILFIVMFLSGFRGNEYVDKALKAIRPAVVALIIVPVLTTAKAAHISKKSVWFPVLVAIVIAFLNISPIYVIVISAAGGIIYSQTLLKQKMKHMENERRDEK
ncbi:MAG: chromate transporter [Bacteroidales bacterium]